MWLFAYFGYWIEIAIVLTARLLKGNLTDAKKKYDLQHARDAEAAIGLPKATMSADTKLGQDRCTTKPQDFVVPNPKMNGDGKEANTDMHSDHLPVPKEDAELEMGHLSDQKPQQHMAQV